MKPRENLNEECQRANRTISATEHLTHVRITVEVHPKHPDPSTRNRLWPLDLPLFLQTSCRPMDKMGRGMTRVRSARASRSEQYYHVAYANGFNMIYHHILHWFPETWNTKPKSLVCDNAPIFSIDLAKPESVSQEGPASLLHLLSFGFDKLLGVGFRFNLFERCFSML